MNKKILILGANGLIGNGLTSYLSTKKINLFLVVRSKKKRVFQEQSNKSNWGIIGDPMSLPDSLGDDFRFEEVNEHLDGVLKKFNDFDFLVIGSHEKITNDTKELVNTYYPNTKCGSLLGSPETYESPVIYSNIPKRSKYSLHDNWINKVVSKHLK